MGPKRVHGDKLGVGKCEPHGCSHYVLFPSPLAIFNHEIPPTQFLLCEVDAFNYGRSLMDTATSRGLK